MPRGLAREWSSVDPIEMLRRVRRALADKSTTEHQKATSILCAARDHLYAIESAVVVVKNETVLCSCGCGEFTPIAPRTKRSNGWLKGTPMPRTPGHRVPMPAFDAATECLNWVGYIDPVNGYGRIGSKFAHRVYYERERGKIPGGLHVDHTCGNRRCVNPDHLEAVTPGENAWRGRMRHIGRQYRELIDFISSC